MAKLYFDPNYPLIIVNSRVFNNNFNNVIPYRDIKLVLDTGSTDTILTYKAIYKLGYNLSSTNNAEMSTVSDQITCPIIKISEFQCMGYTLTDFDVAISNLPYEGQLPSQGLLGMNFLQQFNFNISFDKGYIEIYPRNNLIY